VAGLRWYYQHMLGEVETATSIPYPKEGKTLPKIISREELADLFNACSNPNCYIVFVCALHEQQRTCCKLLKKFKNTNKLYISRKTASVFFPEVASPLQACWTYVNEAIGGDTNSSGNLILNF